MVAPVSSHHRVRAPLVEVIGPAGAGKTSVVRALTTPNAGLHLAEQPTASCYARTLPYVLPTFVDLHRPFRRVMRREMKRVLYLAALQRRLGYAGADSDAVLLDEGPVYMLSRLIFLADEALDTETFRAWWRESVRRWARELRLVIWLDADTAVLTQRIRARQGLPPIPDTSEAALTEFLTRYRGCYDAVLSVMAQGPGPDVVRFDTTSTSVPSLAGAVRAAIAAVQQ